METEATTAEAERAAFKRKMVLLGVQLVVLTGFTLLQRELTSPEPFLWIRSRARESAQQVWAFVWPTVEHEEAPAVVAAEKIVNDLLRTGIHKHD